MFCTTVIPTIGRPSLDRAVESVLEQDLHGAEFEIIVVNDSGEPLTKASWQQSEQVRVITTQRRERSVARNAGAAIAEGAYLHFLDDDDWLLPGALQAFWRLASASDADWLYGGSRLVDLVSGIEVDLHLGLAGNCFVQVITGEWIPLQASIIKVDSFFAVGGFRPTMYSGQDKDLCWRIAFFGNLDYVRETVAVITRRGRDTSAAGYAYGWQLTRREREKVLGEPGSFGRARSSAVSAYWKGRLVRTYLASMIWNVNHKWPVAAASRLLTAALGAVLAGPDLVKPEFWRALSREHVSGTVSGLHLAEVG